MARTRTLLSYKPTIYGIGYLGDVSMIRSDDIYYKMHEVWSNTLSRCYNVKDINYKSYGAKGVSVCEQWLNFSRFYVDVQLLDGWNKYQFKRREIQLDKDVKQLGVVAKIYSVETCIWLCKALNLRVRG